MISPTPLKRVALTPWTLTQQLVGGWTGYLNRAMRQRLTPWGLLTDTGNFWATMLSGQPPAFAHANTVVREWSIAQLRDFGAPGASGVPTLVVAPRSGMTSTGVDLSESASLVGTLLAAGHERTHSLEWFAAKGATASVGIDEHIAVVRQAIATLGGRVHLVGFSQGGWLAAMVAALEPQSVVTLTLGAAPIDFHAGLDLPGKLSYKALGELSDLAGARAECGWVYPGILQASLLRTMEWTEDSARVAKLWAEVGDPERLAENAAVRQWLNTPEDLPGPFLKWSIDELFADNKLVRGTLVVDGEKVNLARISCPLFLITGSEDLISPPEQLLAIREHVRTPADQILHAEAPAGHLDLLFDRDVLATHWAPLLEVAARFD